MRGVAVLAALLGVVIGSSGCTRSSPGASARVWRATSADEAIVATLRLEQDELRLGLAQNWVIELRDRTGTPIYPARIGVNGGMPAHGHGLPTRPEVTSYLDEGRYRIEGLEFNMFGDWTLLFVVDTPAGKNRVQFELELAP